MQRIVSGVQATGNLHIGNYIGAIKNWVKLQYQYETFLFIADLHSITIPQDPTDLYNAIKHTIAAYISCGINPDKVAIFAQSQLHQHIELAWIFNCLTPMGWLNRMTQFKEKAGQNQQLASVGLYDYPVLMAADILLYHADLVPTGEDQTQHLELTRDLAEAFNRQFKLDYFRLPEIYTLNISKRIMSLRDGRKKMSKSDASDYARINLIDSPDVIRAKIKKAKTDSYETIEADLSKRPEIDNLLNIYAILSELSKEAVIQQFSGKTGSYLKQELTELLITHLDPIRIKFNDIIADTPYIKEILQNGRNQVQPIAEKTLKEVKEIAGFFL